MKGQIVHAWGQNLRICGKVLTAYIRENNGKFPASERELFDSRFVRDKVSHFGKTYEVRTDPNSSAWVSCFFGRLKIKYGADINNIKMVNDRLYDTNTGQQILLIDGKYGRNIKKSSEGEISYEGVSYELFKTMLQYNDNDENKVSDKQLNKTILKFPIKYKETIETQIFVSIPNDGYLMKRLLRMSQSCITAELSTTYKLPTHSFDNFRRGRSSVRGGRRGGGNFGGGAGW